MERNLRKPKNERLITHNGETLNLGQWANRLGISRTGLHHRLASRPAAEALSTPPETRRVQKDASLTYDNDPTVMTAVRRNPDGMELRLIGNVLGCVHERVRVIEEQAKLKFEIGMKLIALIGEEAAILEMEALRGRNVAAYEKCLRKAQRKYGFRVVA
jgi:hypothetical protein